MLDSELDTDGYTEEIRRSIVEKAVDKVRSRRIEPAPEVLAIYEQYIIGAISRQTAESLLAERLEKLIIKLNRAADRASGQE